MSHAVVDVGEVKAAFRDLELGGRPVEVHVSLRSFGALQSGPATIVEGVLAAASTVLAATMAPDLFGMPPPLDDRPARNGIDYPTLRGGTEAAPVEGPIGGYDLARTEVSTWLGAFSAHVAARPDRIRCRNASGEFSAVGPLASRLTDADVFGPLRALVEENGAVVLMGVGLTRMTLLHLAIHRSRGLRSSPRRSRQQRRSSCLTEHKSIERFNRTLQTEMLLWDCPTVSCNRA